jgi:hypothetical protein
VSHCTFTGNQAIGADGGLGKAGGTAVGGAIANLGGHNFNATLTVTHSTFTANLATGGQGGSGADGGVGRGGGIFNSGSEAIVVGFATLDLSHSMLLGNQATGGAGGTGAPGGSGGNACGGGIYNDGRSSLELRRSIITDNRATGGAAEPGASAGSGIGGGLYLEAGGSVCLDAFTIAQLFGNHASTSDDDLLGHFTICD